ncbi:cytochrome P450 [Coprinopsis sp. MPI-PUGE-AT-0042]|nr:cytochrome P450 [Coprinopsis sp. MPI-PUGE-AT-0042]
MSIDFNNFNTSTSAAVLGLASHVFFRSNEPSVFVYLAVNGVLLARSFAAANAYAITSGWPAVAIAFKFVAVWNLSMVGSMIAYRLSPLHPLWGYPGPILAKATKLWMVYWTATGKRHLAIARLHETYGDWVRTGPNELSVNAPSAIRPIYSTLFRGPSYQAAPQEADALITTNSRSEHDYRVTGWQKAFSTEALHRYRIGAKARTEQLIDIMREKATSGPLDMSHWIHLWTLDNMGDMAFSGGFETMKAGKDTEGWLEVLHVGLIFVSVLGNIPWMRDVLALAPQPDPILTFQKFAAKKVEETKQKHGGAAKQDILGIVQNETSLSVAQARSDASFIILAGSDTVSEALAGFFRYISGDQDAQQKLREELQSALAENGDIDDATLSRLPYLDACIQETLRLIPPVAAGPPRYSFGEEHHLDGHFIPRRTTVACPNYALHHDAKNFVDPERFMPERWLPNFKGGVHNTEAFVPFCYGPGVCTGKPVALYNMKLLAFKTLINFRLSISKEVDIAKFDNSWREYGIWKHDSLLIDVVPL